MKTNELLTANGIRVGASNADIEEALVELAQEQSDLENALVELAGLLAGGDESNG